MPGLSNTSYCQPEVLGRQRVFYTDACFAFFGMGPALLLESELPGEPELLLAGMPAGATGPAAGKTPKGPKLLLASMPAARARACCEKNARNAS